MSMSVRASMKDVRAASSDAAAELAGRVSGAFGGVKHGVEAAAERVGEAVAPMVEVLPTLPALPSVQVEAPPAKRGHGMFRLNMLQEARRQDDPTYDPKGIRMSRATERLIVRILFYVFSLGAIVFLILALVFQLGLGQASQAAIWAISATLLGGALALNTRVPLKEPNRCVGLAGIVITLTSFAAFIVFCIGASNPDLDKVGMGLGIFVTLFGTIAAGMWTYNLWLPSKRAANALGREDAEDGAKTMGAFQFSSQQHEQGTLAHVEKGTPAFQVKMHMTFNVITVILWYAMAILMIFFAFDIRGLVTDAARFAPPPDNRVPVTNTTFPPEPPRYDVNTSAPTMEPTSPPPTNGPTEPGATYGPTFSPTFMPTYAPSGSPTVSPQTSGPSQGPTNSMPTVSPTFTEPTMSPTESPTTSQPSTSPTTTIPTVSPSSSPSQQPTFSPSTSAPSKAPSESPTASEPTVSPTFTPTDSPTTSEPSVAPTTPRPSSSPSATATNAPTSMRPSVHPTHFPSRNPTQSKPTVSPTHFPSRAPSVSRPTRSPTTTRPSPSPTWFPSRVPSTSRPSRAPSTTKPSRVPTRRPTTRAPTSRAPTSQSPTPAIPTKRPSSAPSMAPTRSPTAAFVPVPEPPLPPLAPGALLANGDMHFVCSGDRNVRPPIILEHDLGTTLDVWAWIQSNLSPNAFVCSYSRRGYGYSTAGNQARTVALTAVELKGALDALNITTPAVLVGHGWAGFSLRRFYQLYPTRVAGLVFLDAHSTQCYNLPSCSATATKADTEGYGQLESVIPFGFIRAAAYAGISYPGPAGMCVPLLPKTWGTPVQESQDRFLASILAPSHWGTSLAEDSRMPQSCAIASQGPGNSANNRITVPVVSIYAENGLYKANQNCAKDLQHAGGGVMNGKKRNAPTAAYMVPNSNHFSLLCDRNNSLVASSLIAGLVDQIRLGSKNFFKFVNSGKMSWASARAFCTARGLRMATARVAENQIDIDDLDLVKDDDSFWLGATDVASQGSFRWVSGELVNAGYSNWQPNEPNNAAGNDCLQIQRSNKKWRAMPCTLLQYPLCESDAF